MEQHKMKYHTKKDFKHISPGDLILIYEMNDGKLPEPVLALAERQETIPGDSNFALKLVGSPYGVEGKNWFINKSLITGWLAAKAVPVDTLG